MLSIIEQDVFCIPIFGDQYETFHAQTQAAPSVFYG